MRVDTAAETHADARRALGVGGGPGDHNAGPGPVARCRGAGQSDRVAPSETFGLDLGHVDFLRRQVKVDRQPRSNDIAAGG
jgi:hypothetical protein